jgi:hypothetical protein
MPKITAKLTSSLKYLGSGRGFSSVLDLFYFNFVPFLILYFHVCVLQNPAHQAHMKPFVTSIDEDERHFCLRICNKGQNNVHVTTNSVCLLSCVYVF